MPLDRQVQSHLNELALQPAPPMWAQTPDEARRQMLAGTIALGPPPDVARLEDVTIDGPGGPIRLRITAPEGPGPFPVLIYYHGGGWVLGSIETHDLVCRAITNAANVVVVSVDYRLAPEHPYPAAADDAYAAAMWVAAHAAALRADPERLAVGGDSAGGNLAAVVALQAREKGGPCFGLQVLIYPITNCDLDNASYIENADGYMLTRTEMVWFWEQYVPDRARRLEPYASPLRANSLAGLPPALVLTAEYDPLRDEGEAYAERLASAGVPVSLSRYDGMIHGFVRRYQFFDQGRTALNEIAAAIQSMAPCR